MTKTLLRSGSLDDFQAVGGGGQAVFDSALQIRETLRLRKRYLTPNERDLAKKAAKKAAS